jgi:tetratricopeptide (TPR) repeat protein
MNARLLSPFWTKRLIVEVDWVEGCKPKPKALTALQKTIDRYTDLGDNAEIILDDVIPWDRWDTVRTTGTTSLVKEYLDHLPGDEQGTEVVYLLYAPKSGPLYGVARTWEFEKDDRFIRARGIMMFCRQFEENSVLWITAAKAERSTLVHEFGHVLGLVSNPAHMHLGNGPHCRNPGCVMTHPRPRTIVYNFLPALFAGQIPKKYCADCRKDIHKAKQIWKSKMANDPEYPDNLTFAADNEYAQAKAWYLWGEGDQASALALINERLALAPENVELLLSLGSMYGLSGRTEQAEATFRTAMETDPDGPVFNSFIDFLCNQGKYETALREIEAKGRQEELYWYTNRCLRGLGRYDEAIELWNRRMEIRAERRFTGLHLLDLYRLTGQLGEAKKLARSMSNGIRRDPGWKLGEGRVELAAGNRLVSRTKYVVGSEEAIKRLRHRRTGEEAKRFYLRTLIRLQIELRNKYRALQAAEALKEFPNSSPYYHLARAEIFASFDERREALVSLEALRGYGTMPEDVCLDEYLDPMRREKRFRQLFPQCVNRS